MLRAEVKTMERAGHTRLRVCYYDGCGALVGTSGRTFKPSEAGDVAEGLRAVREALKCLAIPEVHRVAD